MEEDNVLLMEFYDQTSHFAHGFECGRIWEIIKTGEEVTDMLCQKENEAQIIRMCELFNCNYGIVSIDDNWIELNILKMEIGNDKQGS